MLSFAYCNQISRAWTDYMYCFFFRYNRQFRYEERNGEGYVKGRYGFFDTGGKLQVTKYVKTFDLHGTKN
jgi:hypothetical protein